MINNKALDAMPEKLNPNEAQAAAAACIRSSLEGSSVISDITRHLNTSVGKGIRMQLLCNAALDECGMVPRDAVRGAAAVELFHLATLVHDDIIDDSPVRRGAESVQSKFGRRAAVIGGDYLLCLAASVISPVLSSRINEARPELIRPVTGLLTSVCLGEYRQHINHGNYELGAYDYLKTISGKTAALFTLSAYLGAAVGGCDNPQAKAIARFGNYVGMIFQIMDDCKDYEFSYEEALKPVKRDAAEGIVTLPLILALAKSPEFKSSIQTIGTDALIREVRRLGGTADAKKLAERYGKKAERVIGGLGNELKEERLREILLKALGKS